MDRGYEIAISINLNRKTLRERREYLEREIAKIRGYKGVLQQDAGPEDIPYLETLLETGGLCTPEGLDGLLTEVNEGTKDEKGNVVNKGRVDKWGEDERWTKDYLKYQLRITLIGQEDSIPDYKEVVETLQNGTWMTLQDIKDAGTKAGIDKIRKMLNAKPEEYKLKRDGRTLVAYITPENIKAFKIYYGSPEPGQTKKPESRPVQAEKVTIKLKDRDYEFDPSKTYTPAEAEGYLALLHQHIFGDSRMRGQAIQYLADDECKIPGQKLIDYIRKHKGIMLLTKGTFKTIGRDPNVDMRPDSVAGKLKGGEFAKFRHEVEGGFYSGEVLYSSELPQICQLLRK